MYGVSSNFVVSDVECLKILLETELYNASRRCRDQRCTASLVVAGTRDLQILIYLLE